MKSHSLRAPILRRASIVLLGCLAAWGTPELAGQEPTDSLRLELQRLAQLVDSLRGEVQRLTGEGDSGGAENALAALRAAAAAAAASSGATPSAPDQDQDFVGRQRALQSLNPEISLNADVMAHVAPSEPGQENFFWREFEVSFQSALDPFSRAAVFISRHGPGPEVEPFAGGHGEEGHEEGHAEGGGFDIEEGFVEWVSLPGNTSLKLGKFFQRFGTLNRWHAHALGFQSRSLPHIALLGEEALAQTGISVTWLAPFGGGSSGTYEATVEVTRNENEVLFGESRGTSVLAHVNGFWQLNNSTDIEVGASWLRGQYEDDVEEFSRTAYNAEMALNWIPPARSRQTGLTVRGGYMLLTGLRGDAVLDPANPRGSADGMWSTAELRVSPSWLVGARFDQVRNPAEPGERQWMTSPTLTWWQSEFVRIRAEYDFLSGIDGGDGSGLFLLQATFAMGPHKHATY
jgi:hypothetical protein